MIVKKLVYRGLTVTGALALAIISLTSTEIQAQPTTGTKSATTQANLPTLRLGMRGAAVTNLQNLLKQRGFYRSSITDNFDARTQAAVRTAQIIYKLPKTGVVDAATWQALLKRRFTPLSNLGAPSSTVGAATRGECTVVGIKPMTALVPVVEGKNIGLTVSGHPTLFFYIPEINARVKEADFSLQDENENFVYKTRITLPKSAGAIALTIPESATLPELQVGKSYQWTFSLRCNSQNQEDEPYVSGVIQRVSRPDLVAKVKQISPKDIPAVYAEAGIWHDMLAKLAELRRLAPDDEFLLEEWANYLSAVGLNDFAGEAVVK